MKLLIFVAFMATILKINAGKKLRLMQGMNGGLMNPGMMMGGGMNPGLMMGGGVNPGLMMGGGVNPGLMMGGGVNPGLMMGGGMNPGLMVGGLTPGRMVAGLNPGLMVAGLNPGGAGFIGQPQLGQMISGVPTYVMQSQAVPASSISVPNGGVGQPQLLPMLPGQYQYPGSQTNLLPYYMAAPQMAGMNPPQQQQVMGGQGAAGNPIGQPQQPQDPQQADAVRRYKRFLVRAQALTPHSEIQTPTETTTSSPITCKNMIHV
ncbi:secretory calcium-binding phosphoprotein 9 [Esox lucius]|uniref:secretory calcium-binding phosphoprotein 9 n=1 Tax=Esox lucius TaxID=8010 RepID=UPI0014771044|nr:secretory calcium-binding phosphoprotein 9 [Esox lucius]